jgi:hypothetical protein
MSKKLSGIFESHLSRIPPTNGHLTLHLLEGNIVNGHLSGQI